MIKSMTGYGRAQQLVDGMNITVEIKSVNHRYFEFSSKLSRTYGFLDEKLKSFFNGKLTRGKMECFVQIEAVEEPDTVISLNHNLVKGYMEAYKELSDAFGLENDIKVSDISRVSDIFTVRKQAADEDKIWAAVSVVAQSALDGFITMREREGSRLKADVLSRLDEIISNVEFIEARSPETVKEYNEKLLGNSRQTLGHRVHTS